MKIISLLFSVSLLLLLFSGQSALALSPSVVKKNNAGIDFLALEEPDFESSYRSLMEALQEDPFNPVVRMNLGIWHIKHEEHAKGHKDFVAALKSMGGDKPEVWESLPDGAKELLLPILFNVAVSSTLLKRYDQALHYYQRALMFSPESKEIKTNIELLLKEQQGQGKGDSKNKSKESSSDDKNSEGKEGEGKKKDDKQKQSKNPSGTKQQKPKKQNFKSKELTKNDVRKFLEEIKAQEQKIRAKELQKGQKGSEKENEKDW